MEIPAIAYEEPLSLCPGLQRFSSGDWGSFRSPLSTGKYADLSKSGSGSAGAINNAGGSARLNGKPFAGSREALYNPLRSAISTRRSPIRARSSAMPTYAPLAKSTAISRLSASESRSRPGRALDGRKERGNAVKTSIVILTEIATLAEANAACGWGADNFRVELSADGSAPATHLGLHAMAPESFAADPALATLIVSMRADAHRWGHFDAVTNSAGLQRIEPSVEA